MEHTPTPWGITSPKEYGIKQEQDRLIYHRPKDGEPQHIAEVFQYRNHDCNAADGTAPANADFIVKAANNHDRLVEMLKGLEWGWDGCGDGGVIYSCPECDGVKPKHSADCQLAALLKELEG